jgi:hypothetical protein
MKVFLVVATLCSYVSGEAQPTLFGHYRSFFGRSIRLHLDHSFLYEWHFDLMSSWSQGTFTVIHDTVYLTMIPVFDTIQVSKSGQPADSLILAEDLQPKRTVPPDPTMLSSGGQNREDCPKVLVYQHNRLYEIDVKGKLIRKKQKGFSSNRKFEPWYIKQPD